MVRPSSNWKRVEKAIANLFGAKRITGSGRNNTLSTSSSDTTHSKLYIEIKTRKRIPFMKTWKESVAKAHEERKVPVVVFHERNTRYDESIAMLHVRRYAELEKLVELVNLAIEDSKLWDDVVSLAKNLQEK